jgi:hypothetical protein
LIAGCLDHRKQPRTDKLAPPAAENSEFPLTCNKSPQFGPGRQRRCGDAFATGRFIHYLAQ